MIPADLVAWRLSLDLTKSEAARRLGISRPGLDAYEAGKSPIPVYIGLACAAISAGLVPFERPAGRPELPPEIIKAEHLVSARRRKA